jgi:hypothetical protein
MKFKKILSIHPSSVHFLTKYLLQTLLFFSRKGTEIMKRTPVTFLKEMIRF